jgi:hypothetical protein
MARKLALRTVPLSLPVANGTAVPLFSYADTMLNMLRMGTGGQGLSFDEGCRAVEALGPIQRALEEHAEDVTVSDAQWVTLRERLDKFPFAFADPAIVEFGMMIRNAPEIT